MTSLYVRINANSRVNEFDPGSGFDMIFATGPGTVFADTDVPTVAGIAGGYGILLDVSPTAFSSPPPILPAFPYVEYLPQALTDEQMSTARDNIGAISSVEGGAFVSYEAQTLTDPEKAQARDNIDAVSSLDAGDFVSYAIDQSGTLTDVEKETARNNIGAISEAGSGGNFIAFDADQTLTETEKIQARRNAGVPTSKVISVFDKAYGAKGDWNGSTGTDDTAAINSALAAAAISGGHVDLGNGRFKITGPIKQGTGVGMIGLGGNGFGPAEFICASATACVQVGYDGGIDDEFHPTVAMGFTVDIHGSGDPKGRLQFLAVKPTIHQVQCSDSTVSGTALAGMTPGHAVWFNGCQNMNVEKLVADSVQGSAVVIDNGSGGMRFSQCNFTTSGTLLTVTDQSPASGNGGGFPFGPDDIVFDSCVFETRLDDSYALVDIQCGVEILFTGTCQFSCSTPTAVLTSGSMVRVTSDVIFSTLPGPFNTHVGFGEGCTWNGGAKGAFGGTNPVDAIRVYGANIVDVYGPQFVQNVNNFILCRGPIVTLHFAPTSYVIGGGTANAQRYVASATLTDAKQSISWTGTVTGFKLTYGANTTGILTPAMTPTQIQTALQGLSSIGAGNAIVTGDPAGGGTKLVRFAGALAGIAITDLTVSAVTGGGTVLVSDVQIGGVAPSIINFANVDYFPRLYKMPASMPIAMSILQEGDAFPRVALNRLGSMTFGPGTVAGTSGIGYDGSTGVQATGTAGQFRILAGYSKGFHAAGIATAAASFTADVTAYPGIVFSYTNNSCSLGTFVLGGAPVDGQEFTVVQVQPSPGGATYVWPANVNFNGSAPNGLGDGSVISVTFRYQTSDSIWHEAYRSGNRQADLPSYVQ